MQSSIVGIIGGIGPQSTIEYYRSIVKRYRERVKDGSYPRLIINSIDLKAMLDLVAANRLDELVAMLASEVERLLHAGADIGLLASNTPHIVFDRLVDRSSLPLISIVDAACAATLKHGVRKPVLLGIRFTMQSAFYPAVYERSGITLALPSPEEQERIHAIYVDELLNGIFRPDSARELQRVIRRMKAGEAIDGVVLGGTELPLLLSDSSCEGLPVIDTTKAHVDALMERLWP